MLIGSIFSKGSVQLMGLIRIRLDEIKHWAARDVTDVISTKPLTANDAVYDMSNVVVGNFGSNNDVAVALAA